MRTKKTPKPSSNRIKHKLFGKKIRSEKLSIPDSTVSFFEDMPLYHRKKGKPSSRRTPKKHSYRTRKSIK